MVRKLKGHPARKSSRVIEGEGSPLRDAELQRAADSYNSGNLEAAEAIYAALCERDSRDRTAWYLRGLIAFQGQRYVEAANHLREALRHTAAGPARGDVAVWLGKALNAQKLRAEAKDVLLTGIRNVGDDVERLAEFIEPLMLADGFVELEPILHRIVRLSPRHPRANAELSLFEFRDRKIELALERASIAHAADPEIPTALRVLGHVHHDVGEVNLGSTYYRDAVEAALKGKGHTNVLGVYESMLGALVYADVTDAELRAAHERWETLVIPRPRPRKPIRPRGDRPLRIGYVSPDFRNHAVAFFFEPLLHNHDERLVTPVLYSNTKKPDEVTERIRGVGVAWRDIVGLDDVAAADLVEQDDIDILVDLAGFTIDNRMGIFHLRPAPLQVNYLGYPCTTGLAQMDYRFTDEDCDPLGETDGVYTEQLVRLPGGFYAWRQPDVYPAPGPPPAQKNGHITFGSLNTLAKITDDVIALWSRLMNDVPGSRLILQAEPLTNAWVKDRILGKFARHGVVADRIEMHGRMPMLQHLELYNRIDVALDPFPWGGHTTTCMALFMSVPVVTLRGRRMASRMSASALHRMGFDAWIADDAEQYLQIAKSLASDVDRLATIRLAQRTVFTASGLMDGNRLARAVEAAYQAIWDHHAES
jgi:predicted O-linked N-acetylglucosamine transferase (SPINDLY family)